MQQRLLIVKIQLKKVQNKRLEIWSWKLFDRQEKAWKIFLKDHNDELQWQQSVCSNTKCRIDSEALMKLISHFWFSRAFVGLLSVKFVSCDDCENYLQNKSTSFCCSKPITIKK